MNKICKCQCMYISSRRVMYVTHYECDMDMMAYADYGYRIRVVPRILASSLCGG